MERKSQGSPSHGSPLVSFDVYVVVEGEISCKIPPVRKLEGLAKFLKPTMRRAIDGRQEDPVDVGDMSHVEVASQAIKHDRVDMMVLWIGDRAARVPVVASAEEGNDGIVVIISHEMSMSLQNPTETLNSCIVACPEFAQRQLTWVRDSLSGRIQVRHLEYS